MPTPKEVIDHIIELRQPEGGVEPPSFVEISKAVNEKFGVASTKDAVQKIYQKYGPPPTPRPVETRKCAAIGDLHGNPDPDLIDMVIAENPDVTLVGGDLLHGSEFSKHIPSYKEHIEPIDAEIDRVLLQLKRLKNKIVLLTGNHDENMRKRILESIPTQSRRFVDIYDPLAILADSLDNAVVARTQVKAHMPNGDEMELGETRFLLPVGDLLISHVNYTGVKAMDRLLKFTFDWGDYLGWPKFKTLVQFHTHRLSWTEQLGGHRVLIEPGMAGLPITESYKVSYDQKWQPGVIGGLVFSQKKVGQDWQTELSSLRLLRPHR